MAKMGRPKKIITETDRERQKEQRREYLRKWRAENPEKVKAQQLRYWTKRVQGISAN